MSLGSDTTANTLPRNGQGQQRPCPAKARARVEPRLLRVNEAAHYIGRSPWKLHKMIEDGEIPYISDTTVWLIDRNDLDSWISQQKHYFTEELR